MKGASALLRTLAAAGVDVCFSNPGTSEMQFVAALDEVPDVRAVLCLFEGVATGAADGFGRMAGRPAATLLHLGPGLGNGLANLHNARRARTPVVNIVGDHATYHKRYDAPLESDIDAVASNVSGWIHRPMTAAAAGPAAAEAVAAALGPPGQVATLIAPADVTWDEGAAPAAPLPRRSPAPVGDDRVDAVAKALVSGEPAVVLVGGSVLGDDGALKAASRIAQATGAKLLAETFSSRVRRGAGLPEIERVQYFGEMAEAQLAGTRHLVLVDAVSPVTFFAYPGKPSDLVPAGCEVHPLAAAGDDAAGALVALAERVAADTKPAVQPARRPEVPSGSAPLTALALAEAVGALLPEGAIVSDEGATGGLFLPGATSGAPPHDWLSLTGGAIGQGLPVATGAAVACPDRPVIAIEADGSAMYTIQALWTHAREGLDITTIVLNNRSYNILNIELARVGAEAGGPRARRMLDLSEPDLDFASIATGLGVPSARATTADELVGALRRALAEPGPHLIEAIVPANLF